ncbi:MAG: hypothetical protein CMO74_08840 [Verrucomicrobiales bacterium]|nr:hypothetical protein [Verrucomicrobiales bacterium]
MPLPGQQMSLPPCDLARHVKSFNHPPVAQPSVIYKRWDQPLLTSAVDWLLGDASERVVDLREWQLILPTRQAGRRLREALAWEMDRRGGALFPPKTGTPWQLVKADEQTVASELACLWHWDRVLAEADLAQYRSLFPRLPETLDAAWRRQLARSLHEMRGTLAEGGLDCAAVAAADNCPEPTRWRDLKKLEAAYRRSLGNLLDVHDAKRETAGQPQLADGIRKIAVLGVPDLPVVVQTALESFVEQGVDVHVLTFGPAKGQSLFDTWGRPLPEAWAARALLLGEEQMLACLDETAQAREIAGRLEAYGEQRARHAAVGVADAEVTPRLERALADAEIASFNPDGVPLRRAPLVAFLQALAELLRQPSFANADAFLRLPDAWGWAKGSVEKFSRYRLLRGLDKLRTEHLPTRLDAAAQLHFEDDSPDRIHARSVLVELEKALKRIEKAPLSEGLLEFLQAAFGPRKFVEGRESDGADLEAAAKFMERLGDWEAAVGGERYPAAEALALLLESISREAVFAERLPEAGDIQGWLELAWEDAPHLMVAGVNEGHLPESIHGDLFLPDNLRELLGLRTNADRLARDAWLMKLLLATRAKAGRVEFFVGRQRANGEPLKPSRLLFRCPAKALPVRIRHLFAELPPGPQPPAWEAPWKLAPVAGKTVDHLSASAIRDYLKCPYRFYLRRMVGMKPVDFEQRELDALRFGSLVHDVLEAFGKDAKAHKLKDAAAIQKFFAAELARQVVAKYGKRPPLALRVQQEIAGQRLAHAAHIQAAERAAGWEITDCEKEIDEKLDGLPIIGWIDRIERNRKTGAMRVLDYKTSNKGDGPAKTHWQTFKAGRDDAVPAYAQFEIADKPHVWRDLQLFIYAWALGEMDRDDLELGYFNLPTVGADAGVKLITPVDREVLGAAMACARGVVADVGAGRFWPPATNLKYDDYEGVLFSQPEMCAHEPKGVAA